MHYHQSHTALIYPVHIKHIWLPVLVHLWDTLIKHCELKMDLDSIRYKPLSMLLTGSQTPYRSIMSLSLIPVTTDIAQLLHDQSSPSQGHWPLIQIPSIEDPHAVPANRPGWSMGSTVAIIPITGFTHGSRALTCCHSSKGYRAREGDPLCWCFTWRKIPLEMKRRLSSPQQYIPSTGVDEEHKQALQTACGKNMPCCCQGWPIQKKKKNWAIYNEWFQCGEWDRS